MNEIKMVMVKGCPCQERDIFFPRRGGGEKPRGRFHPTVRTDERTYARVCGPDERTPLLHRAQDREMQML